MSWDNQDFLDFQENLAQPDQWVLKDSQVKQCDCLTGCVCSQNVFVGLNLLGIRAAAAIRATCGMLNIEMPVTGTDMERMQGADLWDITLERCL